MPPKKRLHDDDDDDGDELDFKWSKHKKTKPVSPGSDKASLPSTNSGPETGVSPPAVAPERPVVAPPTRPPVSPPTKPVPPHTPTAKLPSPGKGTSKDSPLSRRLGLTPAQEKERQLQREQKEDAQEREQLAQLVSEENVQVVQDCIEELKAELLAAGVTPSEEKDKKDQKVLVSVGHLGGLILDNQDLRKRLNYQHDVGKPLMLTVPQKAHMKDSLHFLKAMAAEREEKAAKEGGSYVFPSLMSQSNPCELPEDDATQMLEDLVARVRNIV
ncbi:hypothetical protein V8F33_003826 [Rhypophila sp. PSN 637]